MVQNYRISVVGRSWVGLSQSKKFLILRVEYQDEAKHTRDTELWQIHNSGIQATKEHRSRLKSRLAAVNDVA